MQGEIQKAAKGIYPSTKKLNVLMKGPQLDNKVTTQLRLAYEAADKKTKQKYINTANKLISDYKKTIPEIIQNINLLEEIILLTLILLVQGC